MDRKLLLGLIGTGIQRSLSPALHEEEGRHHGLRVHYQLIDVSGDVLDGLMTAVRLMGFAGLNITYPYKQAVLPLLDELSEDARAMGAVNTVVRKGERLLGYNTDGAGWAWGFQRALPNAKVGRVVLLGAGGAGSAVAYAALQFGVEDLVIVDKEPARDDQSDACRKGLGAPAGPQLRHARRRQGHRPRRAPSPHHPQLRGGGGREDDRCAREDCVRQRSRAVGEEV